MARAKRNVFALLGWIVWKLLSLVGFKFAKNKLQSSERDRRRTRR